MGLLDSYDITRWILSGLDPVDFRRPPDLPPAASDFGTVAEKRVSSSDTSNSGALELEGKISVIQRNQEAIKREERENGKICAQVYAMIYLI